MTTYIITRHTATIKWLQSHTDVWAEIITHADETFFEKLSLGDQVIGILPAPLMARICKLTQNPFQHFEINLSPELRGKELSFEDLERLSPKITKFFITEV